MASLALAVDVLARDRASGTLRNVGNAAEKTGGKFSKLGTVAGGVLGGVLGAALGKFAKNSVSAFKEAEQSSARLDDALRKFPATADVTRASLDSLNSALAKKTRFDDDATASGQAVLAQFKLTGTQIKELTPLLQDYAAKTGRDIPSAAGVLGKALQGKGKALADIGIKFKDAGSTGANFEQIVSGLRRQVGGFAEKEGKTAAGQAEILSNQFGEVQETVGSKLVPVLTKLADKLLQVVDFVQRNSAVIKPLAVILGGLGATLFTIVKVTQAWTAVQAALNIVMTANPIGLVVVAIAALVVGLVVAYKKSETFRNIVQGVFKAVGVTVLTFVDIWLGAWQKFAEAMSHIPFIGDKFKGVAEGIGRVRTKIHEMKAELNDLGRNTVRVPVVLDVTTRVGKAVQSEIEKKLDRIDARAAGGPVRKGAAYLVGERGPELMIASHAGRILDATKTRRLSTGAAQILAAWQKMDRLDSARMPTVRPGMNLNMNARLDTSQIVDKRGPGHYEDMFYEDGSSKRAWVSDKRGAKKSGITIHGGIHVVTHKAEDAASAIPRGLRNLSHRLGL